MANHSYRAASTGVLTRFSVRSVVILAILPVLFASGCAKKGLQAIEHKPLPLPAITTSTISASRLLDIQLGGGRKHDPLNLRMVPLNSGYVSMSRSGVIEAVDGQGKSLWKHKAGMALTGGVAASDALVAAGSDQGKVQVWSAQTGEPLWSAAVSGSVITSPLIAGDRLIVLANDGSVTGFDSASGKPIWHFSLPVSKLNIRGQAAPILLNPETVLLASDGGSVYALDRASGLPRWERRVALGDGRNDRERLTDIDSAPAVLGDQVYSTSYQGQVTALDTAAQRMNWTVEASSLQSPAVTPTMVVVSTTEGTVLALSREDGKELWRQESLGWRGLSNPVFVGNHFWVGDQQGYVHALDPATGAIQGRVQAKGAITQLAAQQNRLIVNADNGHYSVWQVS